MAELLPIRAPFANKSSTTMAKLLLLASVFQQSYSELLSFTLESSATMAEYKARAVQGPSLIYLNYTSIQATALMEAWNLLFLQGVIKEQENHFLFTRE
ncbi:hypothetical protein HanXRQr2_Chr05g0203091 [Helianthus annuus]|uniref:Uncharacterized protein n=1 Tax=Helianthus annuus TaxID=4232 RepID=A0A251UNF2_HELAN|nr:hypothetical protein HanXRQr2_Chr05g0203091 [Helianthus annuus]KAJ0569493.1 hypothetical protein HanHA300_Chr05g0166831 [Helianthus annuus]KAJ0583803.1 hypothetical protein HanHA89_Chr05g0180871 [Helianthus annuus]